MMRRWIVFGEEDLMWWVRFERMEGNGEVVWSGGWMGMNLTAEGLGRERRFVRSNV